MNGTDTAVNSAPSSGSSSPTTFAEAFAADASPASSASEQTTTPSAAEQPTAAQESTPATEDDRSPFIPRTRFDEVNGKYNELKQWREKHGWAEQVDRSTVEQAVMLAQKYQSDKVGLLQELIAEAQTDPQAAQQLRSMAARALAQGRGQQPQQTTDTGLPNVEITDAQGNVVGTLGQILEQERQRMLAEIRREFEPVTKTVEQVTAERAHLKAQHDAQQFAGTTMQDASQWPGMDVKENRLAVKAAIEAMQLTSDDPRDLQLALNAAYRTVVLPKLSSKAQSELLDNLKTTAHASTTVNPGSAAPSTPRKITSFHQLGPEAWK